MQHSSTQPKISLVVSDLSASGVLRWGGAGVRPFLLAQALQQLGYGVEVVGFQFGEPATLSSESGVTLQTVPGGEYPQFFQSIRQLLGHIQGDIIYAYKPKPTSLGVALLKKSMSNRPVIADIDDWELSWHGGDRFEYRPSLKQLGRDILKPKGALRNPDHPLYLKWMEGFVSKADLVTTHTRFLQKRFGGTYIPNGKDINLFNPDRYDTETSRQRYGLSDYFILMFPGAPRPYKGLEDVLEALDRLNQPHLRLAIVGGSPYDDYDSQLIERWGRWIIKLPSYPYQQMPEVVAAADVIVVPQRNEPAALAQFPLKLTDGMAMAKPILATRVGDIPEILGDTGYLVEPNAPDQLMEKIQWILQNWPEAQERGRQARERCVQLYSIQAMADGLSEVIAPMVAKIPITTLSDRLSNR